MEVEAVVGEGGGVFREFGDVRVLRDLRDWELKGCSMRRQRLRRRRSAAASSGVAKERRRRESSDGGDLVKVLRWKRKVGLAWRVSLMNNRSMIRDIRR